MFFSSLTTERFCALFCFVGQCTLFWLSSQHHLLFCHKSGNNGQNLIPYFGLVTVIPVELEEGVPSRPKHIHFPKLHRSDPNFRGRSVADLQRCQRKQQQKNVNTLRLMDCRTLHCRSNRTAPTK
uniref:(northern house mosquito) hypothetical protein n=1 Tax=Culex pipiens TaxID=7175 RepID=A0A8D8F1U2_CULPI